MSRMIAGLAVLLVCVLAACDNDLAEPEPLDLSELVGAWALAPVPSMTCTGSGLSATVSFPSVTVDSVSGSTVYLTANVQSDFGGAQVDAGLALQVAADGSFSQNTSFDQTDGSTR